MSAYMVHKVRSFHRAFDVIEASDVLLSSSSSRIKWFSHARVNRAIREKRIL